MQLAGEPPLRAVQTECDEDDFRRANRLRQANSGRGAVRYRLRSTELSTAAEILSDCRYSLLNAKMRKRLHWPNALCYAAKTQPIMSFDSFFDFSRIGRALNCNSVEFLKVDLETGLTFAKVALESVDDVDKKTRNQARSRQAYDFVIERQQGLRIDDEDAKEIFQKLKELRLALAALGEQF
jgi:hypothetical protein